MNIAHSWILQVASEPATDGIPLPLDGGNNVDVKDGVKGCPEGCRCPYLVNLGGCVIMYC